MTGEPWAEAGVEASLVDFRTLLLAASFLPPDADEESPRDDAAGDEAQWIAWSDADVEAAWAAAELAVYCNAAASRGAVPPP